MKRALSSVKKRILKLGKQLLDCCCGDIPNCGCCVEEPPESGNRECVDTGFTGAAGEEYCINELGGEPMKAIWFDRTFRCIPCEYEVVFGTGAVQPLCPQQVLTCISACTDLESVPGFMFFAIDGTFNTDPQCVDCEQVNPPNACFEAECILLQQMFQAIATGGLILDQELTGGGVHNCRYRKSLTIEACRPESCLLNPEDEPCDHVCFVIVDVRAGFNACGAWFVADLSAGCGPSLTNSGCLGFPANVRRPGWAIHIEGGAGLGAINGMGCTSTGLCTAGGTDDLDVTDTQDIFDGPPEIVLLF